jgi:hypothetical protein
MMNLLLTIKPENDQQEDCVIDCVNEVKEFQEGTLLILRKAVAAAQGQLETVGMTYRYNNIWHGFDPFGGNAVSTSAINYRLRGVTLSTTANIENEFPSEDPQRMDYGVAYAINDIVTIGTGYYDYPSWSSTTGDNEEFYEIWSSLELPIALVDNLAASYDFIYVSPYESGADIKAGNLHVLGLNYNLDKLNLMTEVTYNEGVNPFGEKIITDWSHCVFGASYDIELPRKMVLQPAVYHQVSFLDAVNDSDETWFALGVLYQR